MNRREFLEILGLATAGGAVAYSFPEIIVPKNIIPVKAASIGSTLFRVVDDPVYGFGFSGFTSIEIYPKIINDIFFMEGPDMTYWRGRLLK